MVKHQLANQMRGMSVENRDGQYLGQVDDFILDSKSGKVRFLVISFGGWFGLGKKLKAVPTQVVSTATAKMGVVAVDAGWRRWERAPVFEKTDLLRLNKDATAAEALNDYYGPSPAGRSKPGVPRPSPSLRPTGMAGREPNSRHLVRTGTLEFVTKLLRKRVIDRRGQALGEISDLLIDLTDRSPTLAIFGRHSQKFAASLATLTERPEGALQLEVTRERLTNAPPLDDNAWQELSTPAAAIIYRYPSVDRAHDSQSKLLGTDEIQRRLATTDLASPTRVNW